MLMFLASPLAYIVGILIAIELKQAGKLYKGRQLFFNLLTLVLMGIFVTNFPVPSLPIIKLIVVVASLIFNVSDLFHLPKEAGTLLFNIIEILIMVIMLVLVITSLGV